MKVSHMLIQLVLVCTISIMVCYFMVTSINKKKPADEYQQRMDLLESRMDINRDLVGKMNLKIDSVLKLKQKTDVQIVRIRSNKGAANPYISSLSSGELQQLLSKCNLINLRPLLLLLLYSCSSFRWSIQLSEYSRCNLQQIQMVCLDKLIVPALVSLLPILEV